MLPDRDGQGRRAGRPLPARQGLIGLALLASCAHAPPRESFAHLDSIASLEPLARGEGRPRLVHFWALWCSACLEELPAQVAWARDLSQRGVEVVFVDLDGFAKEAAVAEHLRALGALGIGRHALLDMDLDVKDVTSQFDPDWGGVLPATFARGSKGPWAKVIGRATPADVERLSQTLLMR